MRARDSQRSKVYNAERPVFLRHGRTGLSIGECQAYADKIAQSAYVVRRFGSIKVVVDHGRGGGHALKNGHWFDEVWERWHYGNRITLGVWGRQEMVVLHEMAHLYAPSLVAAHGWEFCSIYLDLVRHFLGAQAHADLKAAFKAGRVRFTKPREKRVLSATEREAMAGRMMAMRAARMEKAEIS